MVGVEHEVVVERPLDEVFAYVANPGNVPEWQSGVLETDFAGEMRVGARWREVRTFLGRRVEATLEATAYEPTGEFALRVASGPIPFSVRHFFAPAAGGTRIRIVAHGEPGGLLRFGAAVVARAAERQLRTDYSRLKDVLEGRR